MLSSSTFRAFATLMALAAFTAIAVTAATLAWRALLFSLLALIALHRVVSWGVCAHVHARCRSIWPGGRCICKVLALAT